MSAARRGLSSNGRAIEVRERTIVQVQANTSPRIPVNTVGRLAVSPNSTIRRGPKTPELVAKRILDDIVQQGLVAGSVLPSEAIMCEQYGVGRASVREALRVLEMTGLVSIKTGLGGGPVVANHGSETFGMMSSLYFQFMGATYRDLAEARLGIEPVLAKLAAGRRESSMLAALKEIVTDDHSAKYVEVGSKFHRIIAEGSGNRILSLYTNALHDLLTQRTSFVRHSSVRRRAVGADHLEIYEAIAAGDEAAAEAAMRRHMQEFIPYLERQHPTLSKDVIGSVWVNR